MSVLNTLLEAHSASEAALWTHARVQHLKHSPEPEWPYEHVACLREPCKTVREAIQRSDDG